MLDGSANCPTSQMWIDSIGSTNPKKRYSSHVFSGDVHFPKSLIVWICQIRILNSVPLEFTGRFRVMGNNPIIKRPFVCPLVQVGTPKRIKNPCCNLRKFNSFGFAPARFVPLTKSKCIVGKVCNTFRPEGVPRGAASESL
jgi:hypothetical protein